MKIVQLLPELNQGGVERGAVELNRELVRRHHDSIVVSAGGTLTAQIERDGGQHITLDVCSKNPLTAPLRIGRLKKLLKQMNPDLVHARSRIPAWLCVCALKGLDIPFVTTVHGFNSVSPYSKVMTFGDRVICVSSALKTYIQQHYHTPDEKIRIVHRGLDPEAFSPENLDHRFIEDFKTRFGLTGKYVAASVGRISPLKNFESFIQAVNLCSKEMPDIKGIIIGGARDDKKAYFGELKELVTDLGIEDHITFTGPQDNMAEIYSACDVVVTCSKKPESFGRTLIEAMAMGTPVISPAWGGSLDIIEDSRTGLFCRDNGPESISKCLLRARRIPFTGLRDYVLEKFSLDRMVEKELDVYNELSLE
jgi:glycosyltransferase involved in cell wall biosynthesis